VRFAPTPWFELSLAEDDGEADGLDWEDVDKGAVGYDGQGERIYRVVFTRGEYRVEIYDDDVAERKQRRHHDSLDEAKSACEADYAKRVSAASEDRS
jgi:hypothetical protein